jgi:hypothetical protein
MQWRDFRVTERLGKLLSPANRLAGLDGELVGLHVDSFLSGRAERGHWDVLHPAFRTPALM